MSKQKRIIITGMAFEEGRFHGVTEEEADAILAEHEQVMRDYPPRRKVPTVEAHQAEYQRVMDKWNRRAS